MCVFQIGNCKNVTVMSLRSNKLEFLPDEIGQMTKLRVLNLSDNRYGHTHTCTNTRADGSVGTTVAHMHKYAATLCQWLVQFCSHGLQLPWLHTPQAEQSVGRQIIFLFSLTPSTCVCFRLKNLPFTFTKLKDLAALWLSDNQVSAHTDTPRTHTASV